MTLAFFAGLTGLLAPPAAKDATLSVFTGLLAPLAVFAGLLLPLARLAFGALGGVFNLFGDADLARFSGLLTPDLAQLAARFSSCRFSGRLPAPLDFAFAQCIAQLAQGGIGIDTGGGGGGGVGRRPFALADGSSCSSDA